LSFNLVFKFLSKMMLSFSFPFRYNFFAMEPVNKKYSLKEILFLPVGCALQMPFISVIAFLGIFIFCSFFSYKTLNFDPLHLWSRAFPDYSLSSDLSSMKDERGNTWQISYEGIPSSTFIGLVRHISPDEEQMAPMLSYDILVTSGDYAQSDLVHTVVVNHMFTWRTTQGFKPTGKINLLHTVAKDMDTFKKLREIQNGDKVTINGIEIYRIDAFDKSGKYLGYWMDQGCNTLLVTSVDIQ
jgi:hypothetical protein